MVTLVNYSNIRLHEEQVNAAAKLVAQHRGSSFEDAKQAVISLATSNVTDDTFWKQGLSFVFVVYSGKSSKFAEICVCPLAIS